MTTTSSWLHQQTRMLTIEFLFTWNLLIWNGEKSVPIFLIKRSKNEKRGGRLFKSRTRERVLVTVHYWTSLGATGMVLVNWYTMTLVKVVPHLPHRGHGDQGTGECTLLKGEDNTAGFCSVQFFCELISFSQGWCTLLVVCWLAHVSYSYRLKLLFWIGYDKAQCSTHCLWVCACVFVLAWILCGYSMSIEHIYIRCQGSREI